jgi:hypothetical protein
MGTPAYASALATVWRDSRDSTDGPKLAMLMFAKLQRIAMAVKVAVENQDSKDSLRGPNATFATELPDDAAALALAEISAAVSRLSRWRLGWSLPLNWPTCASRWRSSFFARRRPCPAHLSLPLLLFLFLLLEVFPSSRPCSCARCRSSSPSLISNTTELKLTARCRPRSCSWAGLLPIVGGNANAATTVGQYDDVNAAHTACLPTRLVALRRQTLAARRPQC